MTRKPDKVSARLGKDNLELAEAASKDDFLSRENVYFYDAAPNLKKFATKGSDFEKKVIAKNPQLLVKLAATDVTANPVVLSVEGFQFQPAEKYRLSIRSSVRSRECRSYGRKHDWLHAETHLECRSQCGLL